MIDFGIRNLTLFFKDRSAVALSFLAEFIVVGLYVLFIRDNLIASFPALPQAETLMDIWMLAGILGITPVTTAMGVCGIMVEDKVKRIDRDFTIWPIGRWSLMGGYLFSAVLAALLMSFVLFLFSEIYMFSRYAIWPGAEGMLHIYGILMINAFADAAMALLLVSFLKTGNALAACCTIIGSLIGFLTGIYLPMGSLPEHVQWIVKSFPVSHGAALLRQALMDGMISDHLGGTDSEQAYAFMEYMGVRYEVENVFLSEGASIAFLISSAALCMIVAGFRFRQKNRG